MQNLRVGGVGSPYVQTYRKKDANCYNIKIKYSPLKKAIDSRQVFTAITTFDGPNV